MDSRLPNSHVQVTIVKNCRENSWFWGFFHTILSYKCPLCISILIFIEIFQKYELLIDELRNPYTIYILQLLSFWIYCAKLDSIHLLDISSL